MPDTLPLALHASALASIADPAQDLDAVLTSEGLEAGACEALDYALSYWGLEVLERPADREGVLLLSDLCAACERRAPPAASAFVASLHTYRNLLENKRLALGRAPARSGLRHAEPLLKWLGGQGEVPQSRIVAHLGLSEGRVSQLLSAMEQAGLIRRRREGRDNLVALSAPPASSPSRPTGTEFNPVADILACR